MKKVIWIGLAGTMGALLRTSIGLVIPSVSGFPLGTFIVNCSGTFLLCFVIYGLIDMLSKDLQEAVTTGFLGSFTTFSAVSMETVLLFEDGQIFTGVFYVAASIIFGISFGLLGLHLGRKKVAK